MRICNLNADSSGLFGVMMGCIIQRGFAVAISVLVLFFDSVATAANLRPANLRIILIDDDLYSQIENQDERHLAINELIGDIEKILAFYREQIPTRVLYNLNGEIDDLDEVVQDTDFVDLLRSSWLYKEMRDGRSHNQTTNTYGFDVGRLRDELHDILNEKHRDRRSMGKTYKIDLHVFASRWSRGGSDAGNMLAQEYPGSCYNQEDQGTKIWPGNVRVAVEFRTAHGFPIPTPHALHGFVTILTGSSATNGPIQMRGPAPIGPKCPMADEINAFVNPSGNTNSAPICGQPQILDERRLRTQSRCNTNDHPPIGKIDERPIHMVAREDEVAFGSYSFAQFGTAMKLQIVTGVGGPILHPVSAATAPPGGGRRAQAEISLSPRPGCDAQGILRAEFKATHGRVDLVASRAACHPINLSIGKVTLQ